MGMPSTVVDWAGSEVLIGPGRAVTACAGLKVHLALARPRVEGALALPLEPCRAPQHSVSSPFVWFHSSSGSLTLAGSHSLYSSSLPSH